MFLQNLVCRSCSCEQEPEQYTAIKDQKATR